MRYFRSRGTNHTKYAWLGLILMIPLVIFVGESESFKRIDSIMFGGAKYKLSFAEVSILLPMYNKAHYLKQSMESIFNLPMEPFRYRIVCVDDHSTDNTSQVIAYYQTVADNIDYYYNEQNLGTHVARIRCVMYTRTKYIIWLDPDDCFIGRGAVEALEVMKEKQAGIVEFGCRTTKRMIRRKIFRCWRTPPFEYASAVMYKKMLYRQRTNCHLHRKVFVTEIYKKSILAMPEYIRNARILRCQDNLQIIFYAETMTRPFYYIKTLGEERHYGLPDNSLSSVYQPKNMSIWHCRLQNEYLYQVFGKAAGERLKPGEPNVSVNVPEVPAIPSDL